MFGSEILDVAIGLVFVYLMLSLVSSAVQSDTSLGGQTSRTNSRTTTVRVLLRFSLNPFPA